MEQGLILGISGRARVGKDLFAGMLAEELYSLSGRRFTLMAYAHGLKLRVQEDFDLSYEQLWGDEKETYDKRYVKTRTPEETYWTAREILQSYGEFFRSVDELFWVKHLFRVMEEKEYKDVIVTDVRYPNEAAPIVERGGLIIRVTRPDKPNIHGSNHISETAMDNYKAHLEINNENTVEKLRDSAKQAAKTILGISDKEVNIHKF